MKIIVSLFLILSFYTGASFAAPKQSLFDALKGPESKDNFFDKVQEILEMKKKGTSHPGLENDAHQGENSSFQEIERKQYFDFEGDPSMFLNNVGTLTLDPLTGSIDWSSSFLGKQGSEPGNNNDKDNERRNPNYQQMDWLRRLQNYNDTKPFLFHINYASPEPFMQIARDYERQQLQKACRPDFYTNYISLAFDEASSAIGYNLCLAGEFTEGFFYPKTAKRYSLKLLQEFIEYVFNDILVNTLSDYHFIFHVKSHGFQNKPVVSLSKGLIKAKTSRQNQILEKSDVISDLSISSEVSEKLYLAVKGDENSSKGDGLGNTDLSGDVQYTKGEEFFSENDLYKFVFELKAKINLALFYQESCRSKSSTIRNIPRQLIHIFRRAPGVQNYSSLNWQNFFNPIEVGVSPSTSFKAPERRFGFLYFYDSEIDKVMQQVIEAQRVSIENSNQDRFLQLKPGFEKDINKAVTQLQTNGLETDDFFYYPAMIDMENFTGIENEVSSAEKLVVPSLNLNQKEIISWRENKKDRYSQVEALLLKAYYQSLFKVHSFSAAHKNLFYYFFKSYPNWEQWQLDFHYSLAKFYNYMLDDLAFEQGPRRKNLKVFDGTQYLYAPYAMLNIILHGKRGLEMYNFPTGYKVSLTEEQEQLGVSFTPEGLLYLSNQIDNFDISKLGIDSKNSHYFLRKALKRRHSNLTDYIVQHFADDRDKLYSIFAMSLSLASKYSYYIEYSENPKFRGKSSNIKFYQKFPNLEFTTAYNYEHELEYHWGLREKTLELDIALKFQSYALPKKDYWQLFDSYLEQSNNKEQARSEIANIIKGILPSLENMKEISDSSPEDAADLCNYLELDIPILGNFEELRTDVKTISFYNFIDVNQIPSNSKILWGDLSNCTAGKDWQIRGVQWE